MIVRDKFFIGGQWQPAVGKETLPVTDPSKGFVQGVVPRGTNADADAAIRAAVLALDSWSQTEAAFRADVLERIAAELTKRTDQLVQSIASEVGMPLKIAARVQVAGPLASWARYTQLARDFAFQEVVGNSIVFREPVGVVAAITPWNFPLSQITLKVAPALAAGCTVVLKPSEIAPGVAFILAEAIEAANVPPGVFNLITGLGEEVGEALVTHCEVDAVSFTGSTRVGRRVAELAGKRVRRVLLELGGKSASVVLDDADLAVAVKSTVGNCYLNSGQTCSAHTRLVVPRARFEEALSLAKQAAERFRLGPALAEGTMLGPLVSARQRERVWEYIRRGIEEGAELVCGGAEPPDGLGDGFFVRPTVLATQDAFATIAQEEIFGPVLTVLPHDGDEDAIRIANATPYGLAGGVWSASDERAMKIAKRMRAGQIDLNGAAWNPAAPFGGFGDSGLGREAGVYGLEEFLEYKAVQLRAPPAQVHT
jgi:aldehyde dehydrogenase (NAD+)